MSDAPSRQDVERIEELLVDRALVGLSKAEHDELAMLLARHPEVDATEFDTAVADIDVALSEREFSPLPPELHARLLAEANNRTTASGEEVPREKRSARAWWSWAGWAVAAACLLMAATIWFGRAPNQPDAPTLAEQRLALLKSAKDPLVVEWQAGPTAPAGSSAAGNVVWSDAKQAGFMTFRGLPVNDPREEQYQLWIFDAERDERYPVDGGVFNVESETDVEIVPINPKLRVFEPTMFAISVEPPGGVVVSDRSRLPRLAKVKTD